jgi:hypothetical protein
VFLILGRELARECEVEDGIIEYAYYCCHTVFIIYAY